MTAIDKYGQCQIVKGSGKRCTFAGGDKTWKGENACATHMQSERRKHPHEYSYDGVGFSSPTSTLKTDRYKCSGCDSYEYRVVSGD